MYNTKYFSVIRCTVTLYLWSVNMSKHFSTDFDTHTEDFVAVLTMNMNVFVCKKLKEAYKTCCFQINKNIFLNLDT